MKFASNAFTLAIGLAGALAVGAAAAQTAADTAPNIPAPGKAAGEVRTIAPAEERASAGAIVQEGKSASPLADIAPKPIEPAIARPRPELPATQPASPGKPHGKLRAIENDVKRGVDSRV